MFDEGLSDVAVGGEGVASVTSLERIDGGDGADEAVDGRRPEGADDAGRHQLLDQRLDAAVGRQVLVLASAFQLLGRLAHRLPSFLALLAPVPIKSLEIIHFNSFTFDFISFFLFFFFNFNFFLNFFLNFFIFLFFYFFLIFFNFKILLNFKNF